MKIFIAVPPITEPIIRALKGELLDEPKNRIVIIYPSRPVNHNSANFLSTMLDTNQVVVDARLNCVDEGVIRGMLKEYEESKQVNALIIVSPDTGVAECILELTSEGESTKQWLWEYISLSQPQCAVA